jgi:hypothetical protein
MISKIYRKFDKICQKCGKILCVCVSLAGAGGAPAIEPIISPPEECRLSAPCSTRGDSPSPHDEEHDYVTNPPAIKPMAETGGATAADPFPPGRWSNANMFPPLYRYRPFYRSDDGASMGSPLTLRSISTSA